MESEKRWPLHYAALLQYERQYGHCNPTTTTIYACDLPNMGENGGIYHYNGKLGQWVAGQKSTMKNPLFKHKLSSSQRAKLYNI